MSPVYVHAVGLAAPGIDGWAAGRTLLAAGSGYEGGDLPQLHAGSLLPANERRRITLTIKLALQVALEAVQGTGEDAQRMGTVFATSTGDVDLLDRICRALASRDRAVSPTQFHNSVYNAPSGYWAIACGSRMPSSTVSAFEGSFAAGLLEASAQAVVDDIPTLLVAYDTASQEPLGRVSGCASSFACALALSSTPRAERDVTLRLALVRGNAEDRMDDPRLETLRGAAPAARSLPLLGALAAGEDTRVVLPYVGERQLAVALTAH